jgi:hypothetical protein
VDILLGPRGKYIPVGASGGAILGAIRSQKDIHWTALSVAVPLSMRKKCESTVMLSAVEEFAAVALNMRKKEM